MIAVWVSSSRLGTNVLFTHYQRHLVMKQFDITNSETSTNFSISYSLNLRILFPVKRKLQIVYSGRHWTENVLLFNACSSNFMMKLHLKKGKCPVSQTFPCKSSLLSSLPAPSPKFASEHCQDRRSLTSGFFPLRDKISINTLAKLQLLCILGRNYFSKKKKKFFLRFMIHPFANIALQKKKLKGYFVNHAHRLEEFLKPRNITKRPQD